MSNRTERLCLGFFLFLFIVSGCGGERGDRDMGDAALPEGSEAAVVFCPRSGGPVKYLKIDTLEMVEGDSEMPEETMYIGSAPLPSEFAALTSEAVYLIPTVPDSRTRSVALPALSKDIRVVPTGDGLIVLDRMARRLIGVNLREGSIDFDRSLNHRPEEVYTVAEQDKIVLIMRKGTSGVLSVLSREGGESMTINLDEIVGSAIVEEKGRIYLATRGVEGAARLESFRIEDLSRVFEIDLGETPGGLIHAPGSDKIYMVLPGSGKVRGIDIDSGETLSEFPLGEEGSATLQTDEKGRYLFLLHEERGVLTIVSTKTDRIADEIEDLDGGTRLMTTPDSRYILLQDSGGTRIRLYDGLEFNLLHVFMEDEPVSIGMIRKITGSSVDGGIRPVASDPGSPVGEDIAVSPASIEPVDTPDRYELQVFASNALSSSEQVTGDLLSMGFPAVVDKGVTESGEIWYRVKMGTFSGKEEAAAVGEYLKQVRGLEFWAKPADQDRDYPSDPRIEASLRGRDMDSDGFPEIAVVERDGVAQIFSYRSNQFVSRWRGSLPGGQALCGAIRYSDENMDGRPEAILPLCPLDRDFTIAWDGKRFTSGP